MRTREMNFDEDHDAHNIVQQLRGNRVSGPYYDNWTEKGLNLFNWGHGQKECYGRDIKSMGRKGRECGVVRALQDAVKSGGLCLPAVPPNCQEQCGTRVDGVHPGNFLTRREELVVA